MDDVIKDEIKKGLQGIVDRFTGETKEKVATVVADINFVLASMISDPDNAEMQKANLHLLYGNLSTIAAIEEKELRKRSEDVV